MVSYDTVVGIDPGRKGALAAVTFDGSHRVVRDSFFVPTLKVDYPKQFTKTGRVKKVKRKKSEPAVILDLDKILEVLDSLRHGKTLVAVEQQAPRQRDSKHTVFEVGRSQMCFEMACAALSLDCVIVPPSVWKPVYVPAGADKTESVKAAEKIYDIKFGLVKDESKAEAILIADYTWNNLDKLERSIVCRKKKKRSK